MGDDGDVVTVERIAEWNGWHEAFLAAHPEHRAGVFLVVIDGRPEVARSARYLRAFGRWLAATGRCDDAAARVLFDLARRAEEVAGT